MRRGVLAMYLSEAVDALRERLVRHRLPGGKDLWSTVLRQIARQDSFDGRPADAILEVIKSFLNSPDVETLIALGKQTETGIVDETEEDCLDLDSVRMGLQMELLSEMTNLAWEEAKDRT
jgi:hypothetical protein